MPEENKSSAPKTSLGPDIVPKRKPGEYGFWAEISATDDDGVSVLVNSGDQVRIDSIAGLCSFSERKGIVRVLSIAGALATGGALPALAVPAINAMRKQVENASGSKKRDGFGEEVGGNKYARKEGGDRRLHAQGQRPNLWVGTRCGL